MQLTLVGETGGDHSKSAAERFFGLKSNKLVLNEKLLTITLHAAYFLVVSLVGHRFFTGRLQVVFFFTLIIIILSHFTALFSHIQH